MINPKLVQFELPFNSMKSSLGYYCFPSTKLYFIRVLSIDYTFIFKKVVTDVNRPPPPILYSKKDNIYLFNHFTSQPANTSNKHLKQKKYLLGLLFCMDVMDNS